MIPSGELQFAVQHLTLLPSITPGGKMAWRDGERFDMLFNCASTVINKCKWWEKLTRLKNASIIGNGEAAHAVSGPFQNACSPIHNYLRPCLASTVISSASYTLFLSSAYSRALKLSMSLSSSSPGLQRAAGTQGHPSEVTHCPDTAVLV